MRQSSTGMTLVRAVPAQARPARSSTANSTRVRQPSPAVVAGHRLDGHVDVEPGQPAQLLARPRRP